MDIVKKIEEVAYPSSFWWNSSINKEANISNGLPNCTAFVIGAVAKANIPTPVKVVTDARNWHKNLTNGWYAVPYAEHKNNIKVGDILEWEKGNHVAICSDTTNGVWISGSFYTGVHGVAYYEGNYDDRNGIVNLQQLNDYFYNNYKYRYFHFVPLDEESKWCGGEPDYILVSPASIKNERDITKDQVYVGVTGLRIREKATCECDVLGICSVGYYDVEEVTKGGGYGTGNKWYNIGGKYIAGVDGVIYYPKGEGPAPVKPTSDVSELIDKLQSAFKTVCDELVKTSEERDKYKDKLVQIGVIANDKQ